MFGRTSVLLIFQFCLTVFSIIFKSAHELYFLTENAEVTQLSAILDLNTLNLHPKGTGVFVARAVSDTYMMHRCPEAHWARNTAYPLLT